MKNKLILAFLVINTFAVAQVKNIDRIVAVVGEQPILYSEIETQRFQFINNGQDLGSNAHCIILEQLLFQKLLLTQADLDSIEVSDAQINAELENRIAYFERLIGGREALEKEYGKSIVEIKDEFYEQIADKLKAQAAQRTITQDVAVTPNQVVQFYNSLHKDSIPYVNAQVEIGHIMIKPKISDEQKQKAINELNDYRKLILDGTYKFPAIASLISEDVETAKRGGEVGFVRRGMLVPEFDAAAFSLKEGEITEPFESQFGIHVMQLIERRGEEYNCRHILLIPKVDDAETKRVYDKLDSIAKEIKAGTITFEQAAAKYSEDEETKLNGGSFINPATGDTKLPVNEMDATSFLMIDGMKIGEISSPSAFTTETRENFMRIVILNKRHAPHLASLDTDYNMVKNAAQNDAEGKAMEEWVKSKSKNTSVWIEEEYRNCAFDYQWTTNQTNNN